MSEPQRERLDPSKRVSIPMQLLPIFRSSLANEAGVARKLMFRTWGGLGDQICAEPTLRYGLKAFGDCEHFLASEKPELFSHLNFKRVFDLKEERPIYETSNGYPNYFLMDTITPPDESNLVWQFFSHLLTNAVDFASMCAYRMQLPVADREIFLEGPSAVPLWLQELVKQKTVFIHAGRHWQTKTFPKDWWDKVIDGVADLGIKPILIGANTDDNRGTVDVDADRCLDLRNAITVKQCVWLLQRSAVLLTNDSAPLHMAASRDPRNSKTGHNWIGVVASCKHPDYIKHWRNGLWSYREENLSVSGLWDLLDFNPNSDKDVKAEFVDEEILRSWLPKPEFMVDWTREKLRDA